MTFVSWASYRTYDYAWNNGVYPFLATSYTAFKVAAKKEISEIRENSKKNTVTIGSLIPRVSMPWANTFYATTSSTIAIVSSDTVSVKPF